MPNDKMPNESSDQPDPNDERRAVPRADDPTLPLTSRNVDPRQVPVFNCIAYVKKTPAGVRIRVANLAGIETEAVSERSGLANIVAQFKTATADYLRDGGEIPWIEPVPEAEADEQTRFIPVHL